MPFIRDITLSLRALAKDNRRTSLAPPTLAAAMRPGLHLAMNAFLDLRRRAWHTISLFEGVAAEIGRVLVMRPCLLFGG